MCFFDIFSHSYNFWLILFESRLAIPFATDFWPSVCYKNVVIAEGTENPTQNCAHHPVRRHLYLIWRTSPSWGVGRVKQVPTWSLEEAVDRDGFGCEPAHPGSGCLSRLRALQLGERRRQDPLFCSRRVHLPQECVFHQLYTAEKLCIWKEIGITKASLSQFPI